MVSPVEDNPFQSPMAPQASFSQSSQDISAQGRLDAKGVDLAFQAVHSIWPSAASWLGVGLLFMLGLPLLGKSLVLGLLLMALPSTIYVASVATTRYFAYRHPAWQSILQRVSDSPETQRFQINPEFLKIESPSYSVYVWWSQVVSAVADSNVIVLKLASGRLIPLPIYFFSSDDEFHTVKKLARSPRRYSNRTAQASVPPLEIAAPPPEAIIGRGTPKWREFYAGKSRLDLAPPHIWLLISAILLGVAAAVPFIQMDRAIDLRWMGVSIVASSFTILITLDSIIRLTQLYSEYRRQIRFANTEWIVTADEVRYVSPECSEAFSWQHLSRSLIRRDNMIILFQRNYALSLARRYFATDADWEQVVAWSSDRSVDSGIAR
ncbi:hypothetical protein LOC68_12215 [Blastopirellula sp. JC732]|uniref:YcxB family protein n=1 Tax=Blastopirellula sediminis TaxID=2894196 RepID=A0A9X1MPD3_9BACT|nr:hypothetical protein [Blastopirellula sediminis]MCC9607543.1 hypothetical protein [Blastopirellula sediminis]MCC9629164.1 hypothetical protein [Blastopirellula sediminis]